MTADIADLFPVVCTNEPAEFDHIHACWDGGEPTIENCAYLCRLCHLIKTGTDRKYQAKRRRHKVDRERKKKERVNPGPKMRSRGFDKRYRRKMNGNVERRD